MKTLYQEALDRTLKSLAPAGDSSVLTFTNGLPISILPAWVRSDGTLEVKPEVAAGGVCTFTASYVGYAYVFLTADSGAFVCAYRQASDKAASVTIGPSLLCEPNDVGKRPEPTDARPIPLDSQPVLVGVGIMDRKTNVVISVSRQQFWRLTQDSITLAPGEHRLMSFEEKDGMQQTSSNEKTVTGSFGATAGAGWGPVSVKISASLSSTSTTMQQVVFNKETTKIQEVTLDNKGNKNAVMHLRWQLMDVITIFKNIEPAASVISGISPTLVSKAYDPNSLPPASPLKLDHRVTSPIFSLAKGRAPSARPRGIARTQANRKR